MPRSVGGYKLVRRSILVHVTDDDKQTVALLAHLLHSGERGHGGDFYAFCGALIALNGLVASTALFSSAFRKVWQSSASTVRGETQLWSYSGFLLGHLYLTG